MVCFESICNLFSLVLTLIVPSGFPQSVDGNATDPYSINMTWSPPALEEQSGDIIRYVINVTHADTLETNQYYTSLTHIHITGLDPYTTYVCVVAAETSVGIGPFSYLYFIQTPEAGKFQVSLLLNIQYTISPGWCSATSQCYSSRSY